MTDRTCKRCGKRFRYPADLRSHQKRKTSCAHIVVHSDLSPEALAKPYECRFCHRRFTTPPGLSRHIKRFCRIATCENGMEKLFEHTLQCQLDEQKRATLALERRVAELTSMLQTQTRETKAVPAVSDGAIVTSIQLFGNNSITAQTIHIHTPALPFTRPAQEGGPLIVPYTHIRALFCGPDAKRLYKDWLYAADRRLDFVLAEPVVAELIVDIMRHCHQDPEHRNVYLSKKRADQVLVYDGSTWSTRPLVTALQEIFDGVTEQLRTADQHVLDPSIRAPPNSLEWLDAARYCDAVRILPHAYEARQETVIETARKPATSHFENVRTAIELVIPSLIPNKLAL